MRAEERLVSVVFVVIVMVKVMVVARLDFGLLGLNGVKLAYTPGEIQ